MDEISASAMEITEKIIRRSIYTFLKHYHYFSTAPILILLPFSASALISETIFQPYHFLSFISYFPGSSSSSGFVSCLNMNLFSLPFTVSSFLIAKASIIQVLNHPKPSVPPTVSSVVSNCRPLIFTFFCNLVLSFSINGIIVTLFSVACNFPKAFGSLYVGSTILLPLARIVSYSILSKTYFVSNLALIIAGMDNSLNGYAAIYKACLLREGKNSTALLLTLPTNLGLVAIEALFRYRVLRTNHFLKGFTPCIAFEGILITCLYSLLITLDTIAYCLFYKSSCESSFLQNGSHQRISDDSVVV